MHSQALCFRCKKGGQRSGAGMVTAGLPVQGASQAVVSLERPPHPIPSPPQAHSCSLWTTSSLGLAPPKMAELGLATWLRGVATVRGLSWSRGLCALSSGEGSAAWFTKASWEGALLPPVYALPSYLLLALWNPYWTLEGEGHLWNDFPLGGLFAGHLGDSLPGLLRSHPWNLWKEENHKGFFILPPQSWLYSCVNCLHSILNLVCPASEILLKSSALKTGSKMNVLGNFNTNRLFESQQIKKKNLRREKWNTLF